MLISLVNHEHNDNNNRECLNMNREENLLMKKNKKYEQKDNWLYRLYRKLFGRKEYLVLEFPVKEFEDSESLEETPLSVD